MLLIDGLSRERCLTVIARRGERSPKNDLFFRKRRGISGRARGPGEKERLVPGSGQFRYRTVSVHPLFICIY